MRSLTRPVRLLAAGGTIAMGGERAVPVLNGDELVARVPELAAVPALAAETVLSLPSAYLTLSDAFGLAQRAVATARDGEGVVVTTGTDTLEEVAVLCAMLHDSDAPIVITGANRPATGPGADGAANLIDSVAVAGASVAGGLGVVVVFGGEIHAAMTVQKVDSTGPAAFGSPVAGPLGRIVEGRVWLHARPVRSSVLSVQRLEHRVEIVSPGLGDDGALLRHAGEVADGLVLLALGAGHLSPALLTELRRAVVRIPVVITCRPARPSMLFDTYGFDGAESDLRDSGAHCAPFLSAPAARIVLLCCLGAALVCWAHLGDLRSMGREQRRTPELSTIAAHAAEIADRAERELAALVAVSSPSGDIQGAEEAFAVCSALLPSEAAIERPPCSTPGFAPDLVARIAGSGSRRLLLLGHVDTVIGHEAHALLRREGDRLYGPGTSDMKGGVVLSLGVARALAEGPERFAELAVLLVCDEEWRTAEFAHAPAFEGFDACLCFEAGERGPGGEEGVVVRRKAAGTLRVTATGRASHSGSAPDQGANALVALAETAVALASLHDPSGAERLTVVPTVIRSGEALDVVPAAGELTLDMRADRFEAFEPVRAAVAAEVRGVSLMPRMERLWPGMDSRAATSDLLERASGRLGRRIVGVGRGGASDASHFAAGVPLTVDGLGPRGGGAHTPGEFAFAPSLRERAEVALALAEVALGDY